MDNVGKIWLQNEKQRSQTRRLKNKGVRTIRKYNKSLDKISNTVDAISLQIRKNLQKDKIDKMKLESMRKGMINYRVGERINYTEMRKYLPVPKTTIENMTQLDQDVQDQLDAESFEGRLVSDGDDDEEEVKNQVSQKRRKSKHAKIIQKSARL